MLALNEGLRCKKRLWREHGRQQLEAFRLAPWASRRRRDLLELEAALQLLNAPQLQRNGGGQSDPGSSGSGSDPQSSGTGQPRMSRGAGTLLYDAIFLASNELMKKHQGRKALIILSDGDDRGSKELLQSAIEAAQRADTVVYSILFADSHQDSNGYGHQGGGMGRHGGGFPGGGGWPGGGGSGGGGRGRNPQEPRVDGKKIRSPVLMAKPVAVSTKSLKSRRSIKSTTASLKNCGRNTIWATPRIKAMLKPFITRSPW